MQPKQFADELSLLPRVIPFQIGRQANVGGGPEFRQAVGGATADGTPGIFG